VLNLAAAYDRPLLTTPTSSFAEFMCELDLGVLCEGFTPKAIAEGLLQLEARLARGHAFEFDAYRSRYSWERNAALTYEIYRGLADAEAHRG
jgi:hypothetical protein